MDKSAGRRARYLHEGNAQRLGGAREASGTQSSVLGLALDRLLHLDLTRGLRAVLDLLLARDALTPRREHHVLAVQRGNELAPPSTRPVTNEQASENFDGTGTTSIRLTAVVQQWQ
jgi:hypothetical protein